MTSGKPVTTAPRLEVCFYAPMRPECITEGSLKLNTGRSYGVAMMTLLDFTLAKAMVFPAGENVLLKKVDRVEFSFEKDTIIWEILKAIGFHFQSDTKTSLDSSSNPERFFSLKGKISLFEGSTNVFEEAIVIDNAYLRAYDFEKGCLVVAVRQGVGREITLSLDEEVYVARFIATIESERAPLYSL
jgi:hypothetical protein